MAAIEALIMFDQVLYRPGALVHRWMTQMVGRFTAHAIAAAPMRSGELKAGIEGDTNRVGPKQMEGLISSHAPHTTYVIHGTTGPIRSDSGGRLAVGRNLWPPVTPRYEVQGQTANNFMFVAWRRTARQHSVLRGIRFPGV